MINHKIMNTEDFAEFYDEDDTYVNDTYEDLEALNCKPFPDDPDELDFGEMPIDDPDDEKIDSVEIDVTLLSLPGWMVWGRGVKAIVVNGTFSKILTKDGYFGIEIYAKNDEFYTEVTNLPFVYKNGMWRTEKELEEKDFLDYWD